MHFKLQKQYRLKDYDYSSDGFYFVTICTYNQEEYFGEIKNCKMQLSKIGKIAKKFWLEIPDHNKNTKLDEFVVMPNHLHGIIVISDSYGNVAGFDRRNVACNVPTNKNNKNNYYSKISPKPKSLGTIIRSYKSAITKTIKKELQIYFEWQQRFHDRVIRNNKELNKIRNYIINNPKNWERECSKNPQSNFAIRKNPAAF